MTQTENNPVNKLRKYVATSLALARQTGACPLTIFIKAVVANARYGIGIKYFSLYGMAGKKIGEYDYYMNTREAEKFRRKLNGTTGQEVCRNKLLYYEKCVEFGLPTPRIIGHLAASSFTGSSHGVPGIKSGDHLIKMVIESGLDTFIFKPASSAHGDGLIRFSLMGGKLLDDNDHELDPDKLLFRLQSQADLYILQQAMVPHKSLRPIMPGKGLGTVRMVTVNRNGIVTIEFACLKIPVGNSIADNFACGASGNLLAEIDLVTGVLGTILGPVDAFSGLIEPQCIHPDSHEKISGFKFPQWDKMLAVTEKAAKRFDFLYTIGWDVSLTEDGPCLIEANDRYGVYMLQVAIRRGLRSELKEIFEEI